MTTERSAAHQRELLSETTGAVMRLYQAEDDDAALKDYQLWLLPRMTKGGQKRRTWIGGGLHFRIEGGKDNGIDEVLFLKTGS